ncbi:biotin/lipoyl-containing protein, partial [Euzebya sp.]|uniref:ATP-binding protein n=1 Tax=Euzebya sp. TaxID=1971409 RepID=UPI003519341D
IERMGDKLSARAVAAAADVPVVPGTTEPTDDPAEAVRFGEAHGYPIAVTAAFGGGGRGMKVVRSPAQVRDALAGARREAEASFGRGECYLERYLERPRHVEVQVLADVDGTTIHLGDRDCSLQRRHQKLVEEAPAPRIDDGTRKAIREAAIRVAQEMGYVSAGTCEFLLEDRDDGEQAFYFLEMNTRLQVEHPVTELVTGVDLVAEQLRIAAGEGMGVSQDEVALAGHAIEVRVNAEDPAVGFVPSPGLVTELAVPQGPWVRFDGGVEAGDEIPRTYDSMIGKLIVWGADRDAARRRMARALDEMAVGGVPTTLGFHRLAMADEQFAAATHSTVSVETEWDLSSLVAFDADGAAPEAAPVVVALPGRTTTAREVALTVSGRSLHVTVHGVGTATDGVQTRARRRRDGDRAGGGAATVDGPELRAPMQGVVVAVSAAEGDVLAPGDLVVVIEAMKMENHVVAHRGGVMGPIALEVGDVVEHGAVLTTITDG